MATAKSASFGPYVINKDENNKITISKDGTLCTNIKEALRTVALEAGVEFDEAWTTQQAGTKLINALVAGESIPTKELEEKSRSRANEPAAKEEIASFRASEADIASARVRVYGKAQNRTALGIMHAYMVMYPQAKLEDIEKAFPNSLNPDSGVKKNFVYAEDKGTTADWNGFFKGEDELLTMGDGKKVSVVSMWTKPSFERLVAWAKQYGIVVADFEASKGGGEKGGYRLEYLNGYVPPKAKKGVPVWIWAVIAAVIAILMFLLLFGQKEQKVVEKVVKETIIVRDTVYVQQIEEIEKNFNAAQFAAGKADLSDDAKFVLHDLAKLMKSNPQIRLRLEGHTSAEGDEAFNQKLSEERSAAAVKFLIEHEGVDASRLESVGKGSSELKNTSDPRASENRRTEFIVIEN